MMSRLVHVSLIAALAACASPADRFYTLMPATAATARSAKTSAVGKVVVVGPVTIPAAVDQPQMVINTGDHQVESERWAAPLKDEFTAALAARLGALLPAETVAAHHQSAGLDAAMRILVDVSRFELGPGDRASLDALWIIKNTADGSMRRGRTQVTVPSDGSGFDQLAAAQGIAVQRLAQALAAALSAAGN